MAFGYKISVPLHIILRSGGSVTTILVGWLWGKRYTRLQIISVAFLTIGVIIAAMADAQAQVSPSHHSLPLARLTHRTLGQNILHPLHRHDELPNRPPNPALRANPLRDNGPLHPIHLLHLRFPLARKPLLLTLPLPPTLHPFHPLPAPPIHHPRRLTTPPCTNTTPPSSISSRQTFKHKHHNSTSRAKSSCSPSTP